MGHLFVAQGDLRRLSCDAIAIPCDLRLNIAGAWTEILPPGLPRGDRETWLRLPGEAKNGVVDVGDFEGRRIRAFVAVQGRDTPESVVDRMWRCIDTLSLGLTPRKGHARPLIGVPLVGTGEGGLGGRRGEVINAVLHRHRYSNSDTDIAMILQDRRDVAAVQARRRDGDWPDLSDGLREHADRLGRLAASGQLALFIGAGVSIPAGLPDWQGLLRILASKAGFELTTLNSDPWDAATPIVTALGEAYDEAMVQIFDASCHAVGHALLAGLHLNCMVTTNFDPCIELALESVLGPNRFRVLARQLAQGGQPWLLKLHGDVRVQGSAVLTRRDFDEHKARDRPLRSVVETLLLTSHLLYVGHGLRDQSFLELAHGITKVRQRANDDVPRSTGTALALTRLDAEAAEYRDLEMVWMDEMSRTEGARTLEIFLDRLSWQAVQENERATEYLLDDRYASGLEPEEQALRALLVPLRSASRLVRSSSGWKRVAAMLESLGDDVAGHQRHVD